MQQQPLLEKSTRQLLVSGYLLTAPFLLSLVFPTNPTLTTLANVGMDAFVLIFAVSSSWHFAPVLWRLSKGRLYSVGYGEHTYHWLRGVWLSMGAIWLMLLFDTLNNQFFQFAADWHYALFSVFDLLIWMALLFYTVTYCRRPHQNQEIDHCESSQKYERSALSATEAQKILRDVDQLMAEHQLYLESNLTLDKLAAIAKTQPQYLSQAINQYRKVNFYEFIATYRIEFAKLELTESPGKSVLDIAMSAGFNAKSTFNLTFKKITGQTPSSYRKQQLN